MKKRSASISPAVRRAPARRGDCRFSEGEDALATAGGTPALHNKLALFLAYFNCTFMFKFRATNAHESAVSSIVFEIGLPAPCPALVSMRISTGAAPA